MTQQPSANDVLMGSGGAPTAKFDQPGVTIGGLILAEPRVYQEREYDPRNPGNGAPKFYPRSGDPIMSVSVDVQTNLRDAADPEDVGVRRIYVEGKRLKDAVRDAVRAAGASGLEIGGRLDVTFTGLGVAESAGMNAPKLYTAKYVSAGNAALMADTAEPPASVPASTPAVPSAGPSPADTAKQLIAAGITDDNVIATSTGLGADVIAALRNLPAAS